MFEQVAGYTVYKDFESIEYELSHFQIGFIKRLNAEK